MPTGFAAIPSSAAYALVDARAPAALLASIEGLTVVDDLAQVDIVVAQGKIMGVKPARTTPEGTARFDMRRGIVFPCFVDLHTHLDKGHIWPRRPNPDGTFPGALQSVLEDRKANWTAADVRARMGFSLRCAHAHGTAAIRTHIDSSFGQEDVTWPLLPELRAEWAGRIDLQFSSLASADVMCDRAFAEKIGGLVAAAGGVLGCVTYATPNLAAALDNLFRVALERGLALDFHVDETQDPAARSLAAIAEKAIATRFPHPILVGHCCSIVRQPPQEQAATLDKVAEAGLAVVSLPMCNMYLQERHAGRTPRWRGVTLLHELRARGVRVAVASDNTRDPFYAYGDLDGLEVYAQATRIAHFDHPVGDWPRTVTATPAAIMGLDNRGMVKAGAPADLVLFRARSWTELLSRPWTDRTVLRVGRPIDTTPPDYAELDSLVGAPP
jgi:cytosine deaminase